MPLTFFPRTHGHLTTDHPSVIPGPAGRSWLSQLFAGEVELAALRPAALSMAGRSPAEIDALSRALVCPDLFLLISPDRSAREQSLVDLIRLTAERGERVLALSPDAGAADRLVEAIATERVTRLVRALADDENPHRPTPSVNRFTSTSM